MSPYDFESNPRVEFRIIPKDRIIFQRIDLLVDLVGMEWIENGQIKYESG